MHVFLSPHLDDAVLSCGGLIYQLTQSGQSVLILTLLAGDPPDPLPNTPLVQELHERWNAGHNPYATRRREDQISTQLVGATVEHRAGLDAPYRMNAQGEAIYPEWENVINPYLPADDPLWEFDLALPSQTEVVYAPLGVGRHADHRIVSRLAQALPQEVLFYEEFPYTLSQAAGPVRVAPAYADLTLTPTIHEALANLDRTLTPQIIPLTDAAMHAKMEAIRAHDSQLSTFWPDVATLESGVKGYAQLVAGDSLSYAERIWVPSSK